MISSFTGHDQSSLRTIVLGETSAEATGGPELQ